MVKHANMAPLFSLFGTSMLLLASMHAGFSAEAKKEFKVGDDFGWQEPSENNSAVYSQWAARERFRVSDSISFEYKNDSVLVVDKWGFYHCNTSKAIIAFNNGKSVIKLDRPGPFYFISGTLDHCKNGQRLIVEVMGLHHISHSPPAIAAPPEVHQQAPGPVPSSGKLVSVTTCSAPVALIVTFLPVAWFAP